MFLVALKLYSADHNKPNLHLLVCRQLKAILIGNPAFIASAEAPRKVDDTLAGNMPRALGQQVENNRSDQAVLARICWQYDIPLTAPLIRLP